MAKVNDLLDALPPNSAGMEREMLGTLLVLDWGSDECGCVMSWLDDGDFYDVFHKWLFRIMRNAHQIGALNSRYSIIEFVMRSNDVKKIERDHHLIMAAELAKIFEDGLPFHSRYHAERLRELRLQRAQISLTELLLTKSHDNRVDTESYLCYSRKQLDRLDAIPRSMK